MVPPHILIVEDEKTASKALERKFATSGFEVKIVENGEDAMTALKDGIFDVILLDLIMPKMDGYEVLKQLQDTNYPTPVVVLTNLGTEDDIEKTKILGARAHFVKSTTPMKQVVHTIQELLGLPPTPHND